jgi:hypothetical protein
MARQTDLSKRMLLIFYKIYTSAIHRNKSAVPSQELLHFVNNHISTPISERTLQRDIKGIMGILPIQIGYNSKRGGYTLLEEKVKHGKSGDSDSKLEKKLQESEIARLKERLPLFKLYDPLKNHYSDIPDLPGNYIFLLRNDSTFPPTPEVPVFSHINVNEEPLRVLYTGISTKARLRKRIYTRHLGNNSGKSTLRKSLGRLFGFNLVPRDKNKPNDGYKKFCEEDEEKLTNWMKRSLIVLYDDSVNNYETLQNQLIVYLNPPLNIKDNHNPINLKFRKSLKRLRTGKLDPDSEPHIINNDSCES